MNTKHNSPKKSTKRIVIGSLLLSLFVIIGVGIAAADSESGLAIFQQIKNVIPGVSKKTVQQQPTANELTAAENRAIQALDAEDLAAQDSVVKEFDAGQMAVKPLLTKDLTVETLTDKTLVSGDLAAQDSATKELAAQNLAAQALVKKELAATEALAVKALAAQKTVIQEELTPMETKVSGGVVEAAADEVLLDETETGFTGLTLGFAPMGDIGGSVSGN